MARKKPKTTKASPRAGRLERWAPYFVGLVTFLFFLPGAWYGFINMDDLALIAGNELVTNTSWANFNEVFEKHLYLPHYKPLVYISWIIERSIFGISPHVFHFNNALLHAVNAALVFQLSKRLLPRMWPRLQNVSLAAALCALAWGLHPFRIESVTWAVERKDVLFGLFYLLASLRYIRFIEHRKRLDLVLATLFFLLSCLSKSMGITFPAAVVLFELLFTGKAYFQPESAMRFIPIAVVLLGMLYLYGFIFPPEKNNSRVVRSENAYVPETMNSSTLQFIAISNFRLVGFAAHTVIPVKVAVVYPREYLLERLGGWIYALFAVPLLIVLLLLLKRDLLPTLGFTAAWFAATIAPVLLSEGTGTNFLSDRYTYIPSLGLVWLIIPGVLSGFRGKGIGRFTVGQIVAILIVCILAASTAMNIRHWRSSRALWENMIHKYPVNWYGYYNRAKLISDEDPGQALDDLDKAIDHLPNQSIMYYARGTLRMQQGNTQAAIDDLTNALRYDSDDVQSWINRGSCFRELKQYDNAIADFTEAIGRSPEDVRALNNRALAYMDKGQLQRALADLNQIISIDPEYMNAYLNRANVYVRPQVARYQDAISDYNFYLQKFPDSDNALFRRGYALAQLGRHSEAIPDFTRAIEVQPNQGFYYLGRAKSYQQLGMAAETQRDMQKAKQLGVVQ